MPRSRLANCRGYTGYKVSNICIIYVLRLGHRAAPGVQGFHHINALPQISWDHGVKYRRLLIAGTPYNHTLSHRI